MGKAECLPAGWTVEVRVRRSGKKDRYYLDPVSGYMFRSMKEVLNYLSTGERGKRAFKPRTCSSSSISELGDKKISMLAGCGKCLNLKLSEIAKNEQVLKYACMEGCIHHSERTSDQCKIDTELRRLNFPEAKGPVQKERTDSPKTVILLLPAYQTLQEKQPLENGVGRCEAKETQFETSNQTSQVAARQMYGQETSTAYVFPTGSWTHGQTLWFNHELEAESGPSKCFPHASKSTKLSMEFNNRKRPLSEWANPGKSDDRLKMKYKADEKPGSPLTSSQGNPVIQLTGKALTENKVEEQPEPSLTLPFGDSWPDPCIDFAVKTLTGAIPVGLGIDTRDFFQQQLGSSPGVSDSKLTNASLDNICQTDMSFHWFDTGEKLASYHSRNASLQNSEETGMHQDR